jgi:hypothetical protein
MLPSEVVRFVKASPAKAGYWECQLQGRWSRESKANCVLLLKSFGFISIDDIVVTLIKEHVGPSKHLMPEPTETEAEQV